MTDDVLEYSFSSRTLLCCSTFGEPGIIIVIVNAGCKLPI